MPAKTRAAPGRLAKPGAAQNNRNRNDGHNTANGNATTARVKRTGQCPVCNNEETLDVTPKPRGGWWVDCYSCKAEGRDGGDFIRELAATVGAPGGGALLEDPLRWLGDYLHSAAVAGYTAPAPTEAAVAGWTSRLFSDRRAFAYLTDERGLNESAIEEARLGYDGEQDAIVLPVYVAGELVTIRRRFLHPEPGQPKYKGLAGRPGQLYPCPPAGDAVMLCAGEFDALLASQEGIPAVTGTIGAGGWREEWSAHFAGRVVAVCLDVGEEQAMHKRVAQLRAAGSKAFPVHLGKLRGFTGKDITDALTGSYTADDLKALVNAASRRSTS